MFFFKALSFFLWVLMFQFSAAIEINDRPIIGIVTEEVHSKYAPDATSTIWASYVKFVEAGGARVVPVFIYQSREYYEKLLNQINGVLFPGGGNLLQSEGYGKTGKIIFDLATEMNNRGNYFPLWGTCLGFELLNFLVAGKLWMKSCSAEDLPGNINFVKGYDDSNMFRSLDDSTKLMMENNLVTINYHQWCLTPQNYSVSGLDKYFKVLATNKDYKNVTFISVVEARKYPYYGVFFHPEKVLFEWVHNDKHKNIPHSTEAIKTSQHFANFFINEAKKNLNTFPSKEAEDEWLIYNYAPTFTGRFNNSVEQKYYFY